MRVQKLKPAALILLPMLLATVMVSGQTQTPMGQQGTVFRSTTNYVTTDVLVKDKSGKFVPDLTLTDFEIYEDGVLQKVTNFVPVIGGRALSSATTDVATPKRSEGLILPTSKPAADTSGRVFVIFIDDLHLQALDSPRVRDVLKQIRDILIKDNDLVGMVSSGYSSIAIDLNYDYGKKRFTEAIGKVMGSGMSPQELIEASQTAEGPAGVRYQAHVAFSTANDLLLKAEKITNRRKSFIYVSSGYDFNPFKDSRYRLQQERYAIPERDGNGSVKDPTIGGGIMEPIVDNPFDKNGNQFAESDLIAEIAELVRAARRANVVFYPVDPRGLNSGMADINVRVGSHEWREWITNTVSSLRVLGDETGGFCICEQNDFKKGLQRIDNETSDYYILGYTSNNPDPNKKSRKIEIKSLRPGIELVYKSGYALPIVRKVKDVK
jgi:VWFA-related protein